MENLSFGYKGRTVFDRCNFYLDGSGVYILEGASGSGKSTLLQLIFGMLSPQKGLLVVDGDQSLQLQEDFLIPWMPVVENAMLFAEKTQEGYVKELLKALGIEDPMQLPPTLSKGMRQRVAFIRTMVAKRAIYLLDEPFSASDLERRAIMQDLVLKKAQSALVIVTTHDEFDKQRLNARSFCLEGGSIGQVYA